MRIASDFPNWRFSLQESPLSILLRYFRINPGPAKVRSLGNASFELLLLLLREEC
jgi:hypothetical protein